MPARDYTSEVLGILDDTVNRAAELADEGGYMAHLYAMFLLAQFREVRAYPLLLRLASLPGDLLYSLCGDLITEDFGRILASVCDGELDGIQTLIENVDADEWVRGAALSGLVTLVAAGKKSRQEIVNYFAELFRGKLEREPSNAWNELTACSSDLYPAELMDDIEQAYREGLVDPHFVSFGEIQGDAAMGKDRLLARLSHSPHHRLVEDTVKEMGWWACFHDDEFGRFENGESEPAWSDLGLEIATLSLPFRHPGPKTGRNEPCPCGSGKKYKKCCGA